MKSYRQGDVLLISATIPNSGLKEKGRDEAGRVVLARGEVTGHDHAIRALGVTQFYFESAEKDVAGEIMPDFIRVGGGGADLSHEFINGKKAEHDVIHLPEGEYRIIIQTEVLNGSLTRVVD